MTHKISSIVVGALLSALFTADVHANRACCSSDGTCTMVQSRDQCASGEIQERGVTCADSPCCEEELAQALADLEALQQELDQALADLQTCEDNGGPVCGDGICEGDENEDNCCEDCGCPSCESCVGGTCQSDCGNGTCDPACEDCNSCLTDCAPTCGDGACECGEDNDTCAEDCAASEFVCCEFVPGFFGICTLAAECDPALTIGPCPVVNEICGPSSVCCEIAPGVGFCERTVICDSFGGVNTGPCPDGTFLGEPCN